MTGVEDANAIVNGGNIAATDYHKSNNFKHQRNIC